MKDVLAKRVLPAASVEEAGDAVALAEAVKAGGLNVLEITFRTKAAEESIRCISRAFPDMIMGAGTILTVEQVERAFGAGARFGVAPGSNEAVIRKAADLGMFFMPGVMTPSEIERAFGWGCKALKLFPAEVIGGVKAIEALAGPYAHTGVKFVPTGGINAANMASYLALPVVAAVGGSWMVSKKLVQERNWKEITRLTAEAVKIGR